MTTLNFSGLPPQEQQPQAGPADDDEAQMSFQTGEFVDLDESRAPWAQGFRGDEGLGHVDFSQMDKKVDSDFKNSFPDVCDESDVKR